MKTIITINENYQIIKRKIFNEKQLPNKLVDLIIPIIKRKDTSKNISSANLERGKGA